MKIFSFGFDYCKKQKNNNTISKINTSINSETPSAQNPISDKVKAELKYYQLFKKDSYPANDTSRYYETSPLYYSNDSEILDLVKMLKTDKDVSDKFKEKILLTFIAGQSGNAFYQRVRNANPECVSNDYNELNYNIVKAMLESSPNKNTTEKMLTNQTFRTGRIPLHEADSKTAKLLLEYSPNKETLEKQVTQKDISGLTPLYDFIHNDYDKRKAIVDACDYDTKRKALIDSESLKKIVDMRKFDILNDILSLSPDEETTSDILYALLGDEEVPLSY